MSGASFLPQRMDHLEVNLGHLSAMSIRTFDMKRAGEAMMQQLACAHVTWSRDQISNRYFNILQLGPVEARLQAHWDVIGKNKWAVTFDDITLAVLGVTVSSVCAL